MIFVVAYQLVLLLPHSPRNWKISRDKEDNQQQTQPMLGCSKENEKEKRKKTTATTKIHILLSFEL